MKRFDQYASNSYSDTSQNWCLLQTSKYDKCLSCRVAGSKWST